MDNLHLQDDLAQNPARVVVNTRYGPVTGGRASTGAAAFLEIPYALPPVRFEDAVRLPDDFRYEDKAYVQEATYAVQPHNDGQARDTPFEDKVGLGRTSENPLFLNVVVPASFPEKGNFPVKVYIHGGFLQFGSPHHLGSQAQYIAAERSEVWVNVGYRLSAFGFLACDKPLLKGNYGFKDQWLALQWVKDNIAAFGGNPDDIQVTGLSAGAHSVHQLLHHASRLPEGQKAPFHSAVLQSNAILTNPQTTEEYRAQFRALCLALDLDPGAPDILTTLRDPVKVPWSAITRVIETEALGAYGTFRGCLTEDWLGTSPDPITWQRTGGLAKGLREHGVRSVVVGDLAEEWYLYSIAHPVHTTAGIAPNLRRYFPRDVVDGFLGKWRRIPDDAGSDVVQKLFGEILSCGQVHLPIRLLVEDLHAAGFPVFRYSIEWTPEQNRIEGYVTHGTDRCLWALRFPTLEPRQVEVAKLWLDTINAETRKIEKEGKPLRDVKTILTLGRDMSIQWKEDPRWDEFMALKSILPQR
ncbi:putative carboxylesterase family protein [Lyophyllum shimeji]|uniref:Carboxylic ester hydrolase n=1 Tax=Lyophyllum shimeji TaxID=47721 RepID=A0A9P3PRR7_LYOSH|nr:putative carboxylesterase family protein [Lyophyllum shimeji]